MMLRHNRHQQGFTLVELMVSILISTIMIGVALSQLIGSRTLFALQEADSRIEENARYALEVLTSNIRMASFVDINDGTQATVTGQFFSTNCTGTLAFNPCTDDGATTTGTSTDSDHFAVWYNPPATNEVDCSGNALPTANTTTSVANVFYIDADGLRCASYAVSSSNTATYIADSDQAIIDGIENMQIQYGITDQSYESTAPVRYISAATVNGIGVNATLREKWASIMSVRVTILAGTGINDGLDQAASKTYSVSDAPPMTFTDGNRRKIFSSTVAINNANL